MNLRSVLNLSFLSSDLAIDLGTANTLVFARARAWWSPSRRSWP